MNQSTSLPEPWLRGTLTEVPAVQRAVLHSLQAAEEELAKWCSQLTGEEIHLRPFRLASVAFHLRHIPGSVDRLLTYAEGRELSGEQLAAMKAESDPGDNAGDLLAKLSSALQSAAERVRRFTPADFDQPREVGRKHLPTSVGGLLVHLADHTQRHVGQAITTARLLLVSPRVTEHP
ncbi:MAG TPA: DinB family protein [Candidatus Angelobacter sp.]|jgi:uncharacterized damage-inducible protein DinB|nr:DinB family protein [Candidatus Angelobacter sp.]